MVVQANQVELVGPSIMLYTRRGVMGCTGKFHVSRVVVLFSHHGGVADDLARFQVQITGVAVDRIGG